MDEGGSGQLPALCPLSSLPDGTMAGSCSAPGPAAAEPRVLQTHGGDTEPSGQGSAGHCVTALSRGKCTQAWHQQRQSPSTSALPCVIPPSGLPSDPSFATELWHLTHSPSGSSSPVALPPHTSLRFLNENRESPRHPAPSAPGLQAASVPGALA